MIQNLQYTKYHPRWHRTRMPIFWWVHKWVHLRFILRELTSLSVAFYALVLLFHIQALTRGAPAYADFLTWLKTPLSLGLHAIAFLFVLFHSITWFNLAAKALVLRIGKKRLSGTVIISLNYIAWGILSAAVAWMVLSA